MKNSDRYLKIVEWSEEDQCYVGTCPGLFYGGCHGMFAAGYPCCYSYKNTIIIDTLSLIHISEPTRPY